MYKHAKNQLISSIHFWETADFRVPKSIPILDHHHQKIVKETFSFHEFVSTHQNQFIPLIASWDTASFRVLRPNWLHLFLTMLTLLFFKQLLISMNLYQHAKNRAFYQFILEIYLILKSCNLIGWEDFGPFYLRNKIFSKYKICSRIQQII